MVVEANLAAEPPLRRFRGTYIRPLVPSDYEQLYVAEFIHLHSSWRSRGVTAPMSGFEELVSRGVAAQVLSLVQSSQGESLSGWFQLYNVELEHRIGFLGAARFGDSPLGFAFGAMLFIDHVFAAFDLEQLLIEVPEFNMHVVDAWRDEVLEVAVIPSRVFAHGRRWNLHVFSLSPEAFRSSAVWQMLRAEKSAMSHDLR